MKVLNLCYDDYANFMWDSGMALRSAGMECECLKLIKHPFGYAQEAQVASTVEMRSRARSADIIQFFHSCAPLFKQLLPFIRKKKIIVWHTGTPYRRAPEMMNEIFNPHIDFCMTDQCEFMFLGAKKLRYVATAVDTDKIRFIDKEVKLPYVIAHYPSNPAVKGTDDILRMIGEFESGYRKKFLLECSVDKVSHQENLKRIAGCDIYIELFKAELEGKPYGCYGVTAFEAAALGKIVVTQNIFPNVYKDAYGRELPFTICNTEKDFIRKLNNLVLMNPLVTKEAQQEHRIWLCDNHSYQATGKRLKQILES